MELSHDGILSDCKDKMEKCVQFLDEELKGMRTGRASAALVETVRVDYYGSPTPLGQRAQIATPDARTVAIKPCDAAAVKDIEKAILAANLGVTPNNDGKIIRLNVPPMTEETRKKTVGKVKELAEAQRVAIRNVRREANKNADAASKEGLTEDDVKRLKDDIDKATKASEGQVDQILDAKSKEIMEI